MKRIFYLIALTFFLNNINAQQAYDARISEKEILTPVPNNEPKINGPKIYGVRPGKKFIYRIPCQGERPLKFKVTGLPKGLILDAKKGMISGVVPIEKGQNNMTFVAEN
jgi:alpha-galactosidase